MSRNRRRNRPRKTDLWQEKADVIRRLYLEDRLPTCKIREKMEIDHGFPIYPLAMYEFHIRHVLQLRKELSHADWRAIYQHWLRRHPKRDRKRTQLTHNGNTISWRCAKRYFDKARVREQLDNRAARGITPTLPLGCSIEFREVLMNQRYFQSPASDELTSEGEFVNLEAGSTIASSPFPADVPWPSVEDVPVFSSDDLQFQEWLERQPVAHISDGSGPYRSPTYASQEWRHEHPNTHSSVHQVQQGVSLQELQTKPHCAQSPFEDFATGPRFPSSEFNEWLIENPDRQASVRSAQHPSTLQQQQQQAEHNRTRTPESAVSDDPFATPVPNRSAPSFDLQQVQTKHDRNYTPSGTSVSSDPFRSPVPSRCAPSFELPKKQGKSNRTHTPETSISDDPFQTPVPSVRAPSLESQEWPNEHYVRHVYFNGRWHASSSRICQTRQPHAHTSFEIPVLGGRQASRDSAQRSPPPQESLDGHRRDPTPLENPVSFSSFNSPVPSGRQASPESQGWPHEQCDVNTPPESAGCRSPSEEEIVINYHSENQSESPILGHRFSSRRPQECTVSPEPPSSPLGNITPPSSPPPNPVGCGQAQTQSDSRPPPRPKLQVDLEEIERWPLWKKECFERLLWYSYSDIMLNTMGNLATANSIMLQIRPRALLTPRELEPIEEFLPRLHAMGLFPQFPSHDTDAVPKKAFFYLPRKDPHCYRFLRAWIRNYLGGLSPAPNVDIRVGILDQITFFLDLGLPLRLPGALDMVLECNYAVNDELRREGKQLMQWLLYRDPPEKHEIELMYETMRERGIWGTA